MAEHDTAFVGRVPHSFAVDNGGLIYVSDEATDRLFLFGERGGLERVIGGHGGGPGEFMRIGPITIRHDSVIVQGFQGSLLSVLRASDGKEIARLNHAGYLASASSTSKRLLLGVFGPRMKGTVIGISWDSLIGARPGARLDPAFVEMPTEYYTYAGLELFNQVIALGFGDTLVVGFGGLPYLVVSEVGGTSNDTIVVPQRLRRGAAGRLLERLRSGNLPFHEALSSISNLLGVWRMSDGHYVLWHQEGTTEDPKRKNAEIVGRAYISVLTPDRRHACVDAVIEAPGTMRARLTFARDTLFSLDQIVDPSIGLKSAVHTVVRKYSLSVKTCDWTPTG